MNQEIERKFLVKEVPENLNKHPSTEIIQGYLAITEDGTEVRVRKKGDGYFLAVKNGFGLQRQEVEIDISRDQFEKLWSMTKGRGIEKVRFEIDYSGMKIELDIYKGILNGLIVAEVEFLSIDEARSFIPPDWFGREVTEDERFKNKNLALYGVPDVRTDRPI